MSIEILNRYKRLTQEEYWANENILKFERLNQEVGLNKHEISYYNALVKNLEFIQKELSEIEKEILEK